MEGWIKLHRKMLEWEGFKKSEMVHIFIYLLLSANKKDGNWNGIQVKNGEFITGLLSINKATGVSIQTIRTCLKRLENQHIINKQSNKQYTLITICNYESYQEDEKKSTKKTTIKSTVD